MADRYTRVLAVCIIGIIMQDVSEGTPDFNAQASYAAFAVINHAMETERMIGTQEWWDDQLANRAPNLSRGTGERRRAILFGRASNYGLNNSFVLAPQEYYEQFRFLRQDIAHLVSALQIPHQFIFDGCVIAGDEALLIFLKVSQRFL
jgi:hypothetical protein